MTKLATPGEVAEHLGVTPESLRQWAHRGTGPRWIRVGGGRRYRWSDIEAYLADGTVEPAQGRPQLNCSICKKPVLSDGYLAVSHAEVRKAEAARKAWDEGIARNHAQGGFSPIPAGWEDDIPEPARWFVMHRKCDPNPERVDYWYGIERVDTFPKFLSFLAHVTEKPWVRQHTDLPALIRRVIGE